MVTCCCICNQNHQKGSNITFHRFPRDEELKKKWILAIGRKDWVPGHSVKVCSQHFKRTDFTYNFGSKVVTRGCVPSIFTFPRGEKLYSKRITRSKGEASNDNVTAANSTNEITVQIDNITKFTEIPDDLRFQPNILKPIKHKLNYYNKLESNSTPPKSSDITQNIDKKLIEVSNIVPVTTIAINSDIIRDDNSTDDNFLINSKKMKLASNNDLISIKLGKTESHKISNQNKSTESSKICKISQINQVNKETLARNELNKNVNVTKVLDNLILVPSQLENEDTFTKASNKNMKAKQEKVLILENSMKQTNTININQVKPMTGMKVGNVDTFILHPIQPLIPVLIVNKENLSVHLDKFINTSENNYIDNEQTKEINNKTIEQMSFTKPESVPERRCPKRQNYFGDFTREDLKYPDKVYNMWMCAKNSIGRYKKVIKYLHNKTRRLEKKIMVLEDTIINELNKPDEIDT